MKAERPATALRASLVLGAVASAIVCYLVATQSLILGAREAGWYYGYHAEFSVRYLGVFAAACAAGTLLWLPAPRPGLDEWSRLLAWWAVALGVQWLLRSIAPYTLESLFTSDGANGFYGFAQQHTPGDLLSHFGRLRRGAPLHVQANMPGKVMLVYGLEVLTASPRTLAWLVAALSATGGLVLYVFTKELLRDAGRQSTQSRHDLAQSAPTSGERRRPGDTALFAAILYWCFPARIFFLPIMNTVTPVLVLGCAWLMLRWLRTGRTTYPVALGITVYLLVFFEPLPLVIGLLFAALALRSMADGAITPNRWIAQACLVVVAFIVTAELVRAAFGFDLVTALRQSAAHATAFNETAGRPYGYWIRANLVEFVFGIGVCQAFLFVAVLFVGLRGATAIGVLCLGLIAVLLVTDLIGINRGEVIRLWIFLGAFFQIPAAHACATLPGRTAICVVAACALLQATLGTAMIGFVVA